MPSCSSKKRAAIFRKVGLSSTNSTRIGFILSSEVSRGRQRCLR
jgi:hypothetical protein